MNIEWQQIGGGWVLGEKIRGIIRTPIASIIFYGEPFRWKWQIYGDLNTEGYTRSLNESITIIESTLKIN